MLRTTDCAPADRDSAAPTMLGGPTREALRAAAAKLDLAERRGRPVEMAAALIAMATAYRALKAPGVAEDMLRQALRWARGSGSSDLQVEVLCELGEAACAVADECKDAELTVAHAARERARDVAFEVSSLARQVADPQWEARALLRASDSLNRCGDHEDAAWLQGRALQLLLGASPGGH